MQEAWLDVDVAQCGYCQPGQIMAAVALVNERRGRITDEDLDAIRNVCRCGTYPRIREAIRRAAAEMPPPPRKRKRKRRVRRRRRRRRPPSYVRARARRGRRGATR
ncbi:MAG TPA: 2Fe-2S iron-sulfur cluster-binding protein [Solirubrobacteraceae bacterium]|jgi:isoquinoline 1-oxidoreductase alpha subunit